MGTASIFIPIALLYMYCLANMYPKNLTQKSSWNVKHKNDSLHQRKYSNTSLEQACFIVKISPVIHGQADGQKASTIHCEGQQIDYLITIIIWQSSK